MNNGALFVFDFDETICDENTDTVVHQLLPKNQQQSIRTYARDFGDWNTFMNKVFEELHNNSIDMQQVKKAIVDISAVAGMETLLSTLHADGHEIIIISDSNSLFIDYWLKDKNLDSIISRVFTNPIQFCDNGRMMLGKHHQQTYCTLCPNNLCKGQILTEYINGKNGHGERRKVVYTGDGRNDICPILRLIEDDIACPRQGTPLFKLVHVNFQDRIKAKVVPWKDGEDLLCRLRQFI